MPLGAAVDSVIQRRARRIKGENYYSIGKFRRRGAIRLNLADRRSGLKIHFERARDAHVIAREKLFGGNTVNSFQNSMKMFRAFAFFDFSYFGS